MKDFKDHFFKMFEKLKNKEPFAFSRFSDGELRILQNMDLTLAPKYNIINGKKTMGYYAPENLKEFMPERDKFYHEKLVEAYQFKKKNYYVGLSCRCCVGEKDFRFMLDLYNGDVNSEFLTWSNLFVNSNYSLYKKHFVPEFSKHKIVMICNKNCKLEGLPFPVVKDFRVGPYCMKNNYGMIEEIKKWISSNNIEDHVFLFSAASLSEFLAHQLFEFCDKNTYIDIGTTLNISLGIDNNRGYLKNGRKIRKTCIW